MNQVSSKHIDNIIKHTTKPDYFIDLGVRRNNSEAWLFSKIYPDVPIYGFEPNPITADKIENYPGTFSRNGITNKVGTFSGWHNNCDFKVQYEVDEEDPYQEIKIKSTTLDKLDEELNFKNAIVWADIEGGELRMLRGATKLLLEGRIQAFNLELTPHPPVPEWPNESVIVDYLDAFDYIPIVSDEGTYEQWSRQSHIDFLFMRR